MNEKSGLSLMELLHSPDPDVNRIINTFVTRFNATYGIMGTDRWDITKEDWQRYEFLGEGTEESKQLTEQAAAQRALETLGLVQR